MTAKLLQFPRRKIMKKIDVPTLKLMLKHKELVTNAADRGYSLKAIKRLVRSAEASKR
jgi:hypothetical protein